ncbi:polyphenol oxidase, chloroplastic-like [Gastrolobium bilobum]|uniref:polyphenol oxidase, chloroplastic-like n=1 Tax=Gastrolobium bilobum TaxID=150636 RepID=UPI002AB0CD1A|nr:polyphenol oxidase, chloroplastic-like [Gastrolobium bilobum]
MSTPYPPPLSITANNAASGTLLSTLSFNPKFRNHKSKASKIAKPSQYYNVSRVQLLSCKATKGGDKDKDSKEAINLEMFDRRNILIGLGGLYGAAAATLSNDSLSLAAPISSPEITKCGPPDLPSGAKPTNCCPPISSNIIDFTFPMNPKVKVRPAAHLVDATYLQNYQEAIRRMKALPADDPRNFTQQANIHCAYCDGAYHQVGFPDLDFQVHNSWIFFPFHRWYLYFHEKILGSLIKDLDPNFALPYWNWDSPNGMPIPAMYTDPNSPLYDSLRSANHQPPTLIDLNYNGTEDQNTPEEQASANLNSMYRQLVSNSKTPSLFFGSAYRAGEDSDPGAGSVENIPHGPVHTWTGDNTQPNAEDMGNFYSAGRDPIFFAHHSNVDRMWTIWKTLGGKRNDIADPDWLESGFIFYDENKNLVRVKVKDCLDTTKLGYVYQNVDIPWLEAKPSPSKGRVRRAIAKTFGVGAAHAGETSKETKFPVVLDSTVSAVVKRQRKSRSKKEKDEEEEVLVIEGIEFERDLGVKFDVYINEENDVPGGPTKTEFAGSFVSVPHKHKHKQTKMKTNLRLGITELLEDLGAEDDDHLLVTLVPKIGKGHVTVGGIKIEFHK